MTQPELSADQGDVYRDLLAFAATRASKRPYLVLHGLAGTGKTTVLSKLAHDLPGAILCAFTGKAASVLRSKTALEVSTLHSVIYDFKGLTEDELDPARKRPVFTSKGADLMSRIVLLDECSNVGTRLAEDLLATGARVIACGDPGQLPPVRDQQFFSEPDLTLTEVHRQAWDSAIIRQAHAVRSIGSYAADGVDFRVVDRASEEDLYRAGVALCWRNATRKLLNERRRAVMGHRGRTLRRGEPLMCLKNDHALKLYNGAIYELMNDREPGDDFEVTNDTGGCVTVMCPTVEGFDARFEEQRYDDACLPFALAYGATVHKAQGSEWDEVLLVDEMDSCADRRAMLYTGVTRAAKRITVVRR